MKSLSYHFSEIQEFALAAIWKKVINLSLLIYQPLGTTFLFVTLRLLRPWVWVRVGYIDTLRLGHHLMFPWFFLLANQEKRNPKGKPYRDIYFAGVRNPNPYLLQMWRRKLRVWPWWLVGGGVPNRFITQTNPLNRGHLLRKPDLAEGMKLTRQNPPQLTLSNEELSICRSQMEHLGLPPGAPWVALNVRDSAWLDALVPSLEWRKNEYRNSKIESYVDACLALTQLGFYVVRLGALVQEPIPTISPKIIDYPFLPSRSEWLDLYLSRYCSFILATGSGIDTYSFLTGVPTLFVNYEPSCLTKPFGAPTQVIFKHYVSGEGRYLLLSEILELGIETPYGCSRIADLGIRLQDNSAQEIRDASVDFASWILSGSPKLRPTALQQKVQSKVVQFQKRNCEELPLPLVADSFLVKNPHWIA